MSVRRVVRNYAEAMTHINDGAIDTERWDAPHLKRHVAAMYDSVVPRPAAGAMWNWGLDDERIDRRIRERIPHYDKYETDGFSEQLYFMAIDVVPLELDDYRDKLVVEVGCGMGEGLSFLSRLLPARAFIGLDLSAAAIDRANARLSRDRVTYEQGDAERLPFDDGEVDVLINVESSHTYPDLEAFLREVARVLRPGGYFSHMDLFTRERHALMAQLKDDIEEIDWLREVDVSPMVQAAIRCRMDRDSLLRRSYREKKRRMLIDRLLGERGLMAAYGARFAGFQFGPMWRMVNRAVLPRKTPLQYERYLVSLGQRRCRS